MKRHNYPHYGTLIKNVLFCLMLCCLFSCGSPRVNVKIKSQYSVNNDSLPVAIYYSRESIPIDYEELGKLSIYCNNIYTPCDSTSLYNIADEEVRLAGGNALYIKKFRQRKLIEIINLEASILKVFDFNSPPDTLYYFRSLPTYKIPKKGNWDFLFSIPYINSFLLKIPKEGTYSNTGYWGLMGSLHYYHRKDQYLNLYAGSIMDFYLPVIGAVDPDFNNYDRTYSIYAGISNHHIIRKFHLGYGLNISQNVWLSSQLYSMDWGVANEDWRHSYEQNEDWKYSYKLIEKQRVTNNMGFYLSIYYPVYKTLNLGILYRPDFLRIDPVTKFIYQHAITLDVAWKIRLKTSKK